MSAIYFHSQSETAVALRGSERAYMGVFCNDLLDIGLGLTSRFADAAWLREFLPPKCYVGQCAERELASSLSLFLRNDGSLVLEGRPVDGFTLGLNTMLAIGNDALRLMAKLHAQCEIHCYVEGKNRKWVASIMRDGRASGVYREGQGWESVIDLLERRDDEPVVCSYSVCESFPNFGSLPAQHPIREMNECNAEEAFYQLPRNELWSACMEGLRCDSGLEISPDRFQTFHFGSGYSAFDVKRIAAQNRASKQSAGTA